MGSAIPDPSGRPSADPRPAQGLPPTLHVQMLELLALVRTELGADTAAVLRLEPASQHLVSVGLSSESGQRS